MQNELTAERIEAAIKQLEEMAKCGYEPTRRTCDTALAALRAEQGRQWISVEDRLPDMCGCKCLVVGANRFGQVDVFTAFTGYMEHGKLEFHSCEPTHEIPAWTITHWMPLPAPPENERVATETCAGCRWRGRHQKCSCCRRNRSMRDLWEEAAVDGNV